MRHYDPNPRCECGKVLFLHPERAAFAAVQDAVRYGEAMEIYQCRMHDRFWHVTRVKRRMDPNDRKRAAGGRGR